jgi:hypothetical protein
MIVSLPGTQGAEHSDRTTGKLPNKAANKIKQAPNHISSM